MLQILTFGWLNSILIVWETSLYYTIEYRYLAYCTVGSFHERVWFIRVCALLVFALSLSENVSFFWWRNFENRMSSFEDYVLYANSLKNMTFLFKWFFFKWDKSLMPSHELRYPYFHNIVMTVNRHIPGHKLSTGRHLWWWRSCCSARSCLRCSSRRPPRPAPKGPWWLRTRNWRLVKIGTRKNIVPWSLTLSLELITGLPLFIIC